MASSARSPALRDDAVQEDVVMGLRLTGGSK